MLTARQEIVLRHMSNGHPVTSGDLRRRQIGGERILRELAQLHLIQPYDVRSYVIRIEGRRWLTENTKQKEQEEDA